MFVLSFVTLHYITLHYNTLHCIALHYITLHYFTLHYKTDSYLLLPKFTIFHVTRGGSNKIAILQQTVKLYKLHHAGGQATHRDTKNNEIMYHVTVFAIDLSEFMSTSFRSYSSSYMHILYGPWADRQIDRQINRQT